MDNGLSLPVSLQCPGDAPAANKAVLLISHTYISSMLLGETEERLYSFDGLNLPVGFSTCRTAMGQNSRQRLQV